MPLEWPDNISDWRWFNTVNEIYQPNPNWFQQFLPKKFAEAATDKEGEYSDEIQHYMSCYMLGDSSESRHIRYRTTVIFPMEYDQVKCNLFNKIFKSTKGNLVT